MRVQSRPSSSYITLTYRFCTTIFSERMCVEWLQDHPFVLANKTLQVLLRPQGIDIGFNHMLAALGGPSWFQTRLPTVDVEECIRINCAACESAGANVELRRCRQCKAVRYWYAITSVLLLRLLTDEVAQLGRLPEKGLGVS